MKKVFAIFGVALVLGLAFLPAAIAYAFDPVNTDGTCPHVGQIAQDGNCYDFASEVIPSSVGLDPNGATVQNTLGAINHLLKTGVACLGIVLPGPGGIGSCIKQIVSDFLGIVELILNTALFLIGGLFTFVVKELVVNMGFYVREGTGIKTAWTIVRDLANIGIIGGLIAVAVGLILRLTSVSAEKFLVRLIIAALLVNFSYLFAGAVIDSSNFLATKIYETVIQTGSCAPNCNIADRFQKIASIDSDNISLWAYLTEINGKISSGQDQGQNVDPDTLDLLNKLLAIILIGVSIFVFLSAITLLIGRFVALILVLIASPIGIAAWAIPGKQTAGWSTEWWDALFTQAFFAPVYFLLVGFSLNIMENFRFSTADPTQISVGALITFVIATVFMLQSLRIAKEMSQQAKRLTDAYKYSGYLTGWVGRNTIGFASDRAARFYNQSIAAPIQKGLTDSKFLNPTLFGRQIPIGRGLNLGFNAAIDTPLKDALKKGAETKYGGIGSFRETKEKRKGREAELADVQDYMEKRKKILNEGGLLDQKKDAQEAFDKAVAEAKKIPPESEKPKPKDGKKLTKAEVNEFNKNRKGRHLIEGDNGEWRWEDEWEMRERLRNGGVKGAKYGVGLRDAIDNLKGGTSDMSPERIKDMNDENPQLLLQMAEAFTPEQALAILQDKTIRRDIRDGIRKGRHGEYLKLMQEDENRIAKDKDGKDATVLSKRDTEEGKVLRYSAEYFDMMRNLHEQAKKFINKDEMQDLIVSNVGKDAGIQENAIFWDAITDGMYMGTQSNKNISDGVKRRIRGLKRKRLEDALKLDADATRVFDEEGISGEKREQMEEEVSRLNEEQYNQKLAAADEKEKRLLKAAKDRHTADAQADRWFAGKADSEVQNEIKQESLGKRLVAKKIRINQLRVLTKDQTWITDLKNKIFEEGNDDGAEQWILTNTDGERYGPPTDPDILEKYEKRTASKKVRQINDIEERNRAAAGGTRQETLVEKTKVKVEIDSADFDKKTAEIRNALESLSAEQLSRELPDENLSQPQVVANFTLDDVEFILKNPAKARGLKKIILQTLLTLKAKGKLKKSVLDWLNSPEGEALVARIQE